MIRAVLFDFGETLITFGKVNTTRLFCEGARASYDFLKKQGQPVGNFTVYFWQNLIRIRIEHLLSNIIGRDFDTLALLKKVGEKKGIHLAIQQWEELAWLWYEPLSRVASVEPKIKETLAALKGLGLALGIVSNTFINCTCLERHLRQVGILDFFTVRLYSYEFAFRKPNIKIFETAAERIAQAPSNILYVGDRIDNDIEPALKVGMHAALKEAYTNNSRAVSKNVPKIKHLSELPQLIQKINASLSPV
jgi:HAD superfamily hydrolase (TIGR01549 family)